MDNKLITIDLSLLDKEKPTGLILAKDGKLAKEAEEELLKILATQDLIEKVVAYVKERLGEEMDKSSLIKVKAGNITISKRFFGTRYQINPETPEEYKSAVFYEKPNVENIDKYIEEKKELPIGVSLREREMRVSIVQRSEDE